MHLSVIFFGGLKIKQGLFLQKKVFLILILSIIIQKSDSASIVYWLRRARHLWYRSQYIILRYLTKGHSRLYMHATVFIIMIILLASTQPISVIMVRAIFFRTNFWWFNLLHCFFVLHCLTLVTLAQIIDILPTSIKKYADAICNCIFWILFFISRNQ